PSSAPGKFSELFPSCVVHLNPISILGNVISLPISPLRTR
ncbi:hypothetical protein V3C99_006692, partial [Haemonchus contortus]|uniref:Ovule protein n=1 Tax=Haemonchus contortus TaxID=6289 RepID=A0A7I4YPH7_HAECO